MRKSHVQVHLWEYQVIIVHVIYKMYYIWNKNKRHSFIMYCGWSYLRCYTLKGLDIRGEIFTFLLYVYKYKVSMDFVRA